MEILPGRIHPNSNLPHNTLMLLRQIHRIVAGRLQLVEDMHDGENSALSRALYQQLETLDKLMIMGRRERNLLDELCIHKLVFVDKVFSFQ
ncbi:hypothetical protein CRE_14748 [Caenorhabditis remanei]|uniref:Uncharacterized protein n=1 Tax=Caenorhabditis remanei TaxID=31234 RepID=E3MRQ3_CAERE|nr:hypothetical protein CRE_14748 [Caenorhabditis remanei]